METPCPTAGIPLILLQNLRKYVIEHYDSKWTTTDVCKYIIKEWTKENQSSLVEYLRSYFQTDLHPHLGVSYGHIMPKATLFVSHAWSYCFVDVVNTIEHFLENSVEHHPQTCAIWFDLAVNNQWNTNLPQEWWKTNFLNAVSDIGHTLLIALPWHAPVTLTRAWCLWELYCTRITSSKLTVQLNSSEICDFQRTLRESSDEIMNSFCRLDVTNSQAFLAADKTMILGAVASLPGGIHGMNLLVTTLLREWIQSCARDMLSSSSVSAPRSPHIPSGSPTQIRVTDEDPLVSKEAEKDDKNRHDRSPPLHHLGELDDVVKVAKLLADHGQLDEAAVLFRKALLLHNERDSEDLSFTHLTSTSLAGVLARSGNVIEAEELLTAALDWQAQMLGWSKVTLATASQLANLYSEQCKFAEAESMFQKVLEGQGALGETCLSDSLCTLNSLGCLYYNMNSLDAAEDYFLRALRGREGLFGRYHHLSLRVAGNLAGLYADCQKYNQSEDMYLYVLEGEERVLGTTHVNTLRTVCNLGCLYMDQMKYKESEAMYRRAYKE
jgi:tetratricopeptide (TPR) repeat protein